MAGFTAERDMGTEGAGPAVTWRSAGLSLLLIPLNAYWLVQMELIRYSAHPTTISLFFNAVFILLAVTLVNALVGRWRAGWALRRGELYVIYTSVAWVLGPAPNPATEETPINPVEPPATAIGWWRIN